MKNTGIEKSGTGSVVQSGTGSVVQAGTGKISTEKSIKAVAVGLLLTIVSFAGAATAATTYSGHGLTLSVSPESMEAAVTWQHPTTGRFLIGSGTIKSVDFGSVELLSTSTMQKVAAGGIGKVAAGGIGKVAASGIGKVAASGIGKVAASGIGKDKEEGVSSGSLEFLSTDDGLVAILTVTQKGTQSEYVFELTGSNSAGGTFTLIEEYHIN